jgi:hypothetical protein
VARRGVAQPRRRRPGRRLSVPQRRGTVFPGAPEAAGEIHTAGRTGEDPHPALQSFASRPDAAVHRLGLRMLLERGPPGRAARQTPHRSQGIAARVQTERGRESGESACARQSLLQRTECSIARTLPRLWRPWPLPRPPALLRLGPARGVYMAHSAWRETAGFQLAALHPAPGRCPHRAPSPDRAQPPKRVRVSARLARKRVQPRNRRREHCTSGTGRGASGNRRPYRRGGFYGLLRGFSFWYAMGVSEYS